MPGQQWYPFWQGNRSELLATHVLSSVAQVVSVPHQFDLGFDLLCTLTHQDGNALFAGRAFGVQVKAASEKTIDYGGLDKKGRWKGYELSWLYGQDQPHMVALVSLAEFRVQLFSTSRIWWLRYQVGMPGEVQLVPNCDLEEFEGRSLQNRYKSRPLADPVGGTTADTWKSFRVPLGPPIADVKIGGDDGEDFRESLRFCLDQWIDLDYQNIRHFRSGIPFAMEGQDWATNARMEVPPKIWHFSNGTHDQNIGQLLSAIGPAITSLMLNLNRQGQHEKCEAVKPIADLAWKYGKLDPIGIKVLNTGEGFSPDETGETG